MKKSEENLCDLWDTIKHTNIRITGVSEGEMWQGAEISFKEIIAENFPNLGRDLDIKFTKLILHSINSMQKQLLQDTI